MWWVDGQGGGKSNRLKESRVRVLTRAGVIVGALLLLSACWVTEAEYSGSEGSAKVAVIGDSLIFQSMSRLHAELDPNYQTMLSGNVGFEIAWMQNIALTYGATDPAVMVLNAGTNDVGRGIPTEQLAVSLDQLLANFPNACIVLTTIGEQFSPDPAPTQALNAAFVERADEIIDWNAAVKADPGLVGSDLIHGTPHGYDVFVEMVDAAVGRCVPTTPPS
jgi:hypothetical protein